MSSVQFYEPSIEFVGELFPFETNSSDLDGSGKNSRKRRFSPPSIDSSIVCLDEERSDDEAEDIPLLSLDDDGNVASTTTIRDKKIRFDIRLAELMKDYMPRDTKKYDVDDTSSEALNACKLLTYGKPVVNKKDQAEQMKYKRTMNRRERKKIEVETTPEKYFRTYRKRPLHVDTRATIAATVVDDNVPDVESGDARMMEWKPIHDWLIRYGPNSGTPDPVFGGVEAKRARYGDDFNY